MLRRKLLLPGLTLMLGCSGLGIAQQVPNPPVTNQTVNTSQPGQDVRVRRRAIARRRLKMRRGLRLGRKLNLTDDQKRLHRELRQKYFAATTAQREELRQLREKRRNGTLTAEDKERVQALRKEMRTSMMAMRSESLNSLTPEQRSQIESFRQERKQRREEMLQRRLEFLRNRPSR